MQWIFLAIIAQFLYAFVAVIDKRIVSDEKILPRPFVYAFYTCLIAGMWIVVYGISLVPLPFSIPGVPMVSNIERPTLEVVALALLSAYTFFFALVSMFTALRQANASDVVPVIGATSAIATFGLGYLFLGAPLTPHFTLGIFLLALGTFLVSRFHFSWQTAGFSLHAGIFFGLHYVALKGLFNVTSFDDGFFWSRIAFVFFALTLLMVPTYYEKIRAQTKSTTSQAGALILANKILAGVATLLILQATAQGDPAVVQALGGLQFVFILFFGLFFFRRKTSMQGVDTYTHDTILQKALFVAIMTLGVLVLFQ